MACNKDLILYEQKEIKGKALLVNDIAAIPDVTAPTSTTLYLTKTTQTNPYLFTTGMGADGRFALSYKPEDAANVNLVARTNITAGLFYEAVTPYTSLTANTLGDVQLTLKPQYTKGLLRVNVVEANKADTSLVGATVYLFGNAIQAKTLSMDTPSGIIGQTTTNTKGIALFSDLDNNLTYWVGAKANALSSQPTPVMPTAGSIEKPVKALSQVTTYTLKLPPIETPNQLTISMLEDGLKTPLFGFNVYLFVNKTQAATIDSIAVVGSSKMGTTDQKGQVTFQPIEKGTYYVGAVGTLKGKKRTVSLPDPISITVDVGFKQTTDLYIK